MFDDLAALRKASKLTVQRKAVLVNVAVDKPPNNVYFRCHRDLILDDVTVMRDNEGTSRAFYFVVPGDASPSHSLRPGCGLYLGADQHMAGGGILIWPVPILADRDFKVWKSARAAFDLARDHWTQMVWNEAP